MTEVKDPYRNKEKYLNSGKIKSEDLDKSDLEIINEYLSDMEIGKNVAKNRRGSRSYARLNALKSRIPIVARWINERYNKKVTDVTSDEILDLFSDLTKGIIKKKNGKPYQSSDDYIKDFRAFWNWYIRKQRKENGKTIPDIMIDVSEGENPKPKWVYIMPQYQDLKAKANYDYQVLMDFMIDSGIRSPKELQNVRVLDIEEIDPNKAFLHIRGETSKTFDRKYKLMFSYPQLKRFIETNGLKQEDYIFTKSPIVMNRYFKRLGFKVFGDNLSKAGKKYSKLTLYDFRHNSACYWLPRYPTESGLRYRFGWKTGKMIDYYTEFLGMKDNIQEENLLTDTTKTQLEKELDQEKQRVDILEEQLKNRDEDIKELLKLKKVLQAIMKDPKKKQMLES